MPLALWPFPTAMFGWGGGGGGWKSLQSGKVWVERGEWRVWSVGWFGLENMTAFDVHSKISFTYPRRSLP